MEIAGKYAAGDRIFAKVKGYPYWPAIVTKWEKSRYEVFFYGTFEKATLKEDFILDYNPENIDMLTPKHRTRKSYLEALNQISASPEIVQQHGYCHLDVNIGTEHVDVDATKSSQHECESGTFKPQTDDILDVTPRSIFSSLEEGNENQIRRLSTQQDTSVRAEDDGSICVKDQEFDVSIEALDSEEDAEWRPSQDKNLPDVAVAIESTDTEGSSTEASSAMSSQEQSKSTEEAARRRNLRRKSDDDLQNQSKEEDEASNSVKRNLKENNSTANNEVGSKLINEFNNLPMAMISDDSIKVKGGCENVDNSTPNFLYITHRGKLHNKQEMSGIVQNIFRKRNDQESAQIILGNNTEFSRFMNRIGDVPKLVNKVSNEHKVAIGKKMSSALDTVFYVKMNSLPPVSKVTIPIGVTLISFRQWISSDVMPGEGYFNQPKTNGSKPSLEKTWKPMKDITNLSTANRFNFKKRDVVNNLSKFQPEDLCRNDQLIQRNFFKHSNKENANKQRQSRDENKDEDHEPNETQENNSTNENQEKDDVDSANFELEKSNETLVNIDPNLAETNFILPKPNIRVDKRNINMTTDEFVQGQKPEATVRSNHSHWKDFTNFIKETHPNQNIDFNLEKMKSEELMTHLIFYFKNALKHDGNMFNCSTYTTKINSIKKYLKDNKGPTLDSNQLDKISEVIAKRKRQSAAAGETSGKHRAHAFTREHMALLKAKGQLGHHNPDALKNLVYLTLNTQFGLRPRKEMYTATMSDIEEGPVDGDGIPSYLRLSERLRKNMQGVSGEHGSMDYNKKMTRNFETPELCGIVAWVFYKSKKDPDSTQPQSPLFHNKIVMKEEKYKNAPYWYGKGRTGINLLGDLLKTMASKCGIDVKASHIKGNTGRKTVTGSLSTGANANPVFVAKHLGQRGLGSQMSYTTPDYECNEAMSTIVNKAIGGEKLESFEKELEKAHKKTDVKIGKIEEEGDFNIDCQTDVNPLLKKLILKQTNSKQSKCRDKSSAEDSPSDESSDRKPSSRVSKYVSKHKSKERSSQSHKSKVKSSNTKERSLSKSSSERRSSSHFEQNRRQRSPSPSSSESYSPHRSKKSKNYRSGIRAERKCRSREKSRNQSIPASKRKYNSRERSRNQSGTRSREKYRTPEKSRSKSGKRSRENWRRRDSSKNRSSTSSRERFRNKEMSRSMSRTRFQEKYESQERSKSQSRARYRVKYKRRDRSRNRSSTRSRSRERSKRSSRERTRSDSRDAFYRGEKSKHRFNSSRSRNSRSKSRGRGDSYSRPIYRRSRSSSKEDSIRKRSSFRRTSFKRGITCGSPRKDFVESRNNHSYTDDSYLRSYSGNNRMINQHGGSFYTSSSHPFLTADQWSGSPLPVYWPNQPEASYRTEENSGVLMPGQFSTKSFSSSSVRRDMDGVQIQCQQTNYSTERSIPVVQSSTERTIPVVQTMRRDFEVRSANFDQVIENREELW